MPRVHMLFMWQCCTTQVRYTVIGAMATIACSGKEISAACTLLIWCIEVVGAPVDFNESDNHVDSIIV